MAQARPEVVLLPAAVEPSPAQRALYTARQPKTVVEAQLHRQTSQAAYALPDGQRGEATLVDLAPEIHVWLVLRLAADGGATSDWHLENTAGTAQRVRLRGGGAGGLILTRDGAEHPCALWDTAPSALELARSTGAAYAPLCDGALALRNPTVGSRTRMEWTTDFLRDHVWKGEQITQIVKSTLLADAERQTAELSAGVADDSPPGGGPSPARVGAEVDGRLLNPVGLGLPVDGAVDDMLRVGAWYPLHAVPGAWASVLQPRFVDPAIFAQNADRTHPLDHLEGGAMVYSVAFDLAAFDLGYELGTDHPRVGWSDQVPDAARAAELLGPDGYADLTPLVRTGTLDPTYIPRLVGVFAGGFKRAHGAMSTGALSKQSSGSHYGFVAYGVALSNPQPGLATMVVWADGQTELRTWTEADAARLPEVRHARQNGVPLVETDPATGQIRAGALVTRWAEGNWSGSAEGVLRSVRGGLCLQASDAGRFLIVSYYSNATPSAMAQVSTAYGCGYAMMLDMNALEHTYLAVHAREDGGLAVYPLVRGMEVLDRKKGDATYPRFVGYADNRDFFYLLRR